MKRLRLQFGLRTLLLTSTIIALIIGITEKKAVEQRQLKAVLYELNAKFDQEHSFAWLPDSVEDLLGEDRSTHITSVRIIGYRAPNVSIADNLARSPYALLSPGSLSKLLRMPAMSTVSELDIVGTAVTSEVMPAIAQLNLEKLVLNSCRLSRDEMDQLRQRMPGCEVDCSTLAHVSHWLEVAVPEDVLPDLAVFSRARDGDLTSITELIDLTVEWNEPKIVRLVSKVLQSVTGRQARERVLRGLNHESALAQLTVLRSLTVAELEQVEFEVLERCSSHSNPQVRRAFVQYIMDQENDPRKLHFLVQASKDSDSRVRSDAMKGLEMRNDVYELDELIE